MVNIVQLTVRYLNATIYRTIRNPKLEIVLDGSNQTRQNPRVDGYGAGFGPPRSSRSGFRTILELNRTVFAVQTRTAGGLLGLVANTIMHSRSVFHISLTIPVNQYLVRAEAIHLPKFAKQW